MEISSSVNEIEVDGEVLEKIAKTAHEVNRAYCEAIGDLSQPSWKDASENIKQSAINGVIFTLMNPESTPEDSHKSWSTFKLKDGWIFGKNKDAAKKTHPCLVEYPELPVEQRAKDYLFRATVRQASDLLGVSKNV